MAANSDNNQCLTPDGSDAAGNDQRGPTSAENSAEARALAHAERVPTPPATPFGQRPMDCDEIELEISSPQLRLFTGRLYLALPDVRPPNLEEEEISDVIQHLETDLKAAFGKIKAKSHRKPWRESSLIIDMRMSGSLEEGSTKVKLKPCIWFFCGSRWCRKIVEKDIKKLTWRLPCRMQIVDKGGPLLAASDDSGVDDCGSDVSTVAGPSGLPPPPYGAADPSWSSIRNPRTDVYKTIRRQGRPTNIYLLPCEFAILTDCKRMFPSDEADKWIDHIKSHLRGVLPRKLRCWYCVDHFFDADESCGGDKRLNFHLRMEHILNHILFDGLPASWARPDRFVINHLKIHNLVDEQTWNHIATRNIVLSGPGCLAVRTSSLVGLSKGVDETSLKLSDDKFLEFYVQESYADSSIGLKCRSTIRRHGKIISEKFSNMGGVITVTRASETTLYGVTSGHGLVCQILENTSRTPGEPNESPGGSSESSVYSGDSSSDEMPQDEASRSHDTAPTAPREKFEKWLNASHGLVATFLGLRAGSVKSGIVPRETSPGSDGMAGDLALIKVPTDHAASLRNDFLGPERPIGRPERGEGGKSKLFVLLSKARSVAASRVAGTVHFSVGGRKVETARIMLLEELGECTKYNFSPIRL